MPRTSWGLLKEIKMQVHFETFRQDADMVWTDKKGATHNFPQFSVEITISMNNKEDRRFVSCSNIYNGWVKLHDLAVRFVKAGDKVWPGTATYWIDSGNINNLTPNIDKRGSFSLAGYFADFEGKKVVSQHNAVI